MKELDFFDAMTGIDDAYVLEAHESAAHHSPARFGGFRRAAVLIAAVMLLVVMAVGVVAEDWNLTPVAVYEKYVKNDHLQFFRASGGKCYGVDDTEELVDGIQYRCSYAYVCTETLAQSYVVSEGGTILVRMEAMVLMEDGRVEYKSVRWEGIGDVMLELDHYVEGEPGIIIHVRGTVYAITQEGAWEIRRSSQYLPAALGFDIPVGTDARFPDSKFSYDGRG